MQLKTQLEIGKKVLKALIDHGHLAYFVGGFVRDFLLEMESNDIDITTSALPEETMNLFEKTRPTGLKYGTITVFLEEYSFEVTTFRNDGFYLNNRHPDSVQFSTNLHDDLSRRDFTINALAMDIDGHIVDDFNGLSDLKKGIIKAIGNPNERFTEDALRILRTFRFVSKCNFNIDELTIDSVMTHHPLLHKISNERIIQEFSKLIHYPYYQKAFQMLAKTHVIDSIPDLSEGITFLSTHAFENMSDLHFYSLCFYLHIDCNFDNWKFSNKQKLTIQNIINLIEVTRDDSFNELLIYSYGLETCLVANDINKVLNPNNDQSKYIKSVFDGLPIHKTCDLKFKGQDILELTELKNAFEIGEIIDDLVYKIITNELQNDYDILKQYTMKTYFNR